MILCFVGRKTYQSEPVNWEIKRGIDLGKPVVAVYLVDEKLRLPMALQEHSILPVRCQLKEIIKELDRATS